MANPIFKMMNGGNNRPDMVTQFRKFMEQMKGKNPDQILNELVSSGKVNQAQLNKVQGMAQQMQGQFDGMKNIFGF